MIYILLPVHQSRAYAESFARGLLRQTVSAFRLLLLDDGSTDGTSDAVQEILPGTVILKGDGSWWWAGALHQGWLWLQSQHLAEEDVVLICNDDVELPVDFLAQGLGLLKENPHALVVAKVKDCASEAPQETCFTIDYADCRVELAKPGEAILCAPTRGLFVRWADMRRIGGFRPRLIPHYLADLEWTLRAHRRGLAIIRDDRLWLVPDRERTGHHNLQGLPPRERLRGLFSRKYAGNPLAWCAFVITGFPLRAQLPALAHIGWAAFRVTLGK
jgi:GT2 family glycosyltransferase